MVFELAVPIVFKRWCACVFRLLFLYRKSYAARKRCPKSYFRSVYLCSGFVCLYHESVFFFPLSPFAFILPLSEVHSTYIYSANVGGLFTSILPL